MENGVEKEVVVVAKGTGNPKVIKMTMQSSELIIYTEAPTQTNPLEKSSYKKKKLL